jgi:hypothetical protein
MADAIKCAVCGESNAADQEFCQYCQSRLQPLTGPLRGADAPLHPGQIPTKKVTAELEPILPQWLRDARDKARSSAEDVPSQGMQQQHEQAPSSAGASEPDLLAGLQSQARGGDDEEDTPDWLASITGTSPKSKKVDPTSSEARRVELGDIGDFARDTGSLEENTPSWLANMQAASQDTEKDELKDWFRDSSALGQKKDETPSSDSSDWLNQPSAVPPSSADAPDWLRQMSAESDAGSNPPPSWLDSDVREETKSADPAPFAGSDFGAFEADTSSIADAPAWLQGMDSTTPAADALPDNDWLKGFDSPQPDQPLKKNTTPLWLKGTQNSGAPIPDAETPVWLEDDSPDAQLPPIESQPSIPSSDEPIGFGEIPSWLKAAAPQSSVFDSPAEEAAAFPSETSGWLSTFGSSEPSAPTPISSDQENENASPAAFTPDAFQDGSADALFTEMPDWLSNASPPVSSAPPSTVQDSLTPGELPSWVQAMRPVGGGISQSASSAGDQTLETRGALSGLHGVLPAVPGYAPSSKPRVYSIKLQATQEQQSHAALLEQILAAEAEPVPITSFSPLRASRSLRWVLSVMVITLVFMGTSFDLPVFATPSLPAEFNMRGEIRRNELRDALTFAQNVTVDAPVLVAMDYQPARAGEMEAAAAPMFDQMMVLRHPRLIFISTDETGALMAERFISGALAERGYQYGSQYLNLGYLPGGMMGIRSFTQDPMRAMPFDIFLQPAWALAPLQGVTSLSQFAALIVVTDNADSARAWIEQTTAVRGATPLVVISSAQAAPMVQPYYESGQISGIVNGLHGGTIFEQNNAGRPGTARRYWDAYSLGMLLALPLMLGGGLWSLALGLRDRAAAREGR